MVEIRASGLTRVVGVIVGFWTPLRIRVLGCGARLVKVLRLWWLGRTVDEAARSHELSVDEISMESCLGEASMLRPPT